LKRIAGNSSKNEKTYFSPRILYLYPVTPPNIIVKDFKTGKFKFEYEVDGVKRRFLNEMTALKLKILKAK
jgi:hypothetical protein